MSNNNNALAAIAGGGFVAVMCALLARKQYANQVAKVREEVERAVAQQTAGGKSERQSMRGKVVVVTGASSGIGKAIARAFHQQGALVAIGARRMERLEELSKESGDSSRMLPIKTDVTNAASIQRLVDKAEDAFGSGVDVLVNVAGVMYFTLMKNCQTDEWNRTVDVNCKGVMNGFAAVLPGMVSRGKGHIITISSDAGRRVFPSLAVYCASKYFVEALSEATRRELIGTGLRVTTIQPGDCATDLGKYLLCTVIPTATLFFFLFLLTHTHHVLPFPVRENTDKEALDALEIKAGAVVGEGWGNKWNVLKPEDVADSVLYAATAPAHVAVNEVLVEPRDQA